MALKALMLRSRVVAAEKRLEELRKLDAGFSTREAELEQSVHELTEKPDATEEERQAVEAAVTAFDTEHGTHEDEKRTLEETINTLNADLAAEEAKQPKPVVDAKKQEERMGDGTMEKRGFRCMSAEERSAFVQRDSVKAFLCSVRDLCQKRSITGTDLTIPLQVMPLLVDSTERHSKLLKHVQVKPVSGTARVRVQGVVPEAVWTEMGGKINELSLGFTSTDVDGYKVAGYFSIPNWVLEDSDISLMGIIVDTLGQSIGLAVDKAILYGTGTKMPLGIVPRLAQTSKPATGHVDAVVWKDLHSTNIASITTANSVGAKLFQSLLTTAAAAKPNYSNGEKFWAMNEATLNKLKAEALTINANGAIVTGMDNQMPIVGGAIETLSFLPDNVLIGGYGDLYLLAQRSDTKIAASDQVRFLDDETVVKGTARYDGQPVIGAGFVAIGINAATVSATAVTFTADAANTVTDEE